MQMFNARTRLREAGIGLPFRELLAMKIRGTLSSEFVDALIQGKEAGLDTPVDQLEAHALANGDVRNVVRAACILHEGADTIPWNSLFAVDLAAHDELVALARRFVAMAANGENASFRDLCREFWCEKNQQPKGGNEATHESV